MPVLDGRLRGFDAVRPADARPVDALAAGFFTAGGLAVFIAEAGGSRLGSCARDECRHVFVDTSRGGRRTYCSARCGNKDAVHRYRDRQKARQHPGRQARSANL